MIDPIIFTFAAIVFVLVLFLAVQNRIAHNDLKKQLKKYDDTERFYFLDDDIVIKK